MRRLPISSTGLRFLQRLAYSLLQATLFGTILGVLVYFRPPRAQLSEGAAPVTLLSRPAAGLESWERITYDGRVRAVGCLLYTSDAADE